jgi:hypothetical protein
MLKKITHNHHVMIIHLLKNFNNKNMILLKKINILKKENMIFKINILNYNLKSNQNSHFSKNKYHSIRLKKHKILIKSKPSKRNFLFEKVDITSLSQIKKMSTMLTHNVKQTNNKIMTLIYINQA